MTIRIVRLGSQRIREEGLRIGTVRRPPRVVPKNEYASQNWYDVWLPNVAPSPELMKIGQAAESEKAWAAFVKKYRCGDGRLLKRAGFSICLLRCPIMPTCQLAVTAKTSTAVTGPSCASCWRSGALNSNESACSPAPKETDMPFHGDSAALAGKRVRGPS